MSLRFRSTSLIAFMLMLCLCGCQKVAPPPVQNQLKVALPTDPPQLDSRKSRDVTSIAVVKLFGEGLTRHGFNGQLQPGLATSYEIDESLTRYTFTLREGLKWSDGTPLTAHDFEYTWKKVLDPRFATEYAYMLFVIKNAQAAKQGRRNLEHVGVRALDDLTLEVELSAPVPYFPSMVAFCTFFPVKCDIDSKGSSWSHNITAGFPCSGPYQLMEWKHHKELVLVKNPHYWDACNVSIDSIHISIVPDGITALNLFEKGELDFIGTPFCNIPVESLPEWRQKGLLHSTPVAKSLSYTINTTLPVLRNQKIRQALSLAIDRSSIADNVTLGSMYPSETFLPPAMMLNKNLIPLKAQPSLAQQLFIEGINEEGLSLSELPRLHLSLNNSDIDRSIAQAIQQQWKENLGFEISLESMEWKAYINKIHKLNFEIGRLNWEADFDDPINCLEVYKYADPVLCGNNATGWEDPRFLHLLQEAATAPPYERKRILAEAERLLVDACPVIPLFHHSLNWLNSSRLSNLSVSGLGSIDFKWAKLESTSAGV